MELILNTLVFLFGLAVGSFSNVCVGRWHEGTSVVSPGSHCDTCGHAIKWYENIPVLSYLYLKGKCSHCHVELSLQYPLIEFITGCSFLAIYSIYGLSANCLLLMFVTWLFIVATVSDINYREIPNELTLISIPVMILTVVFNINSVEAVLFGIAPAVLITIFMLIGSIANPAFIEYLGGGDIKFLFSVGGIMGIGFVLVLLFVSCFVLVLVYASYIIEDAVTDKQTYVPMMVGFGITYFLMMMMHYLSSPQFDVLRLLGFFYIY